MYPFFEVLTGCMTEEIFLREICRKYHYEEPQLPLLAAVAVSMQERLLADVRTGKAGWCCAQEKAGPYGKGRSVRPYRGEDSKQLTGVCITLGPGIDALQEDYLESGLLSEAYMTEIIASELLLKAYPQWNEWLAAQGSCHVKRYYFPGSEPGYPIELLPELLEELEAPVACTEAYCLLPKKSVAFYAELTEEQGTVCEGICAGCGSSNCPNRMEKNGAVNYVPDMTDRPFTYGYRRIFGL